MGAVFGGDTDEEVSIVIDETLSVSFESSLAPSALVSLAEQVECDGMLTCNVTVTSAAAKSVTMTLERSYAHGVSKQAGARRSLTASPNLVQALLAQDPLATVSAQITELAAVVQERSGPLAALILYCAPMLRSQSPRAPVFAITPSPLPSSRLPSAPLLPPPRPSFCAAPPTHRTRAPRQTLYTLTLLLAHIFDILH